MKIRAVLGGPYLLIVGGRQYGFGPVALNTSCRAEANWNITSTWRRYVRPRPLYGALRGPAFWGSCTSSSPQVIGTIYEVHALHDPDLTDSRAPRHRTSRFQPRGSSHVEVSDLRVSALDATMSPKSPQSIVATHYGPDLQGIRTPRFSQAKVLHYTWTAGTPECGDLEDRGPSSAGSWRSGLQCV